MSGFVLKQRFSVFVLSLLLFLSAALSGTGQTPSATLIDPAIAQSVAIGQVQLSYPAFAWRLLDRVDLVDADKEPTAYAFLFAKADGDFQSMADVQSHIAAAQPGWPDDDRFAFAQIATIITGARDTDALIFRHFRGIPEFYIAAEQERQAGRTPVVVMENPAVYQVIGEDGESVSALRKWLAPREEDKQWKAVQERKIQRRERQEQRQQELSEKERGFYEEAVLDRAAKQKDKWAAVRSRMQGGDAQ